MGVQRFGRAVPQTGIEITTRLRAVLTPTHRNITPPRAETVERSVSYAKPDDPGYDRVGYAACWVPGFGIGQYGTSKHVLYM